LAPAKGLSSSAFLGRLLDDAYSSAFILFHNRGNLVGVDQ
jgi:hypothetical protein